MRWMGMLLACGLLGISGATALAQEPTSSPARVEAARLYLSQSLASLHQARAYAVQVVELGGVDGIDLGRYVADVDRVANGLQRYLTPEAGPPGVAPPVGITGQYLLEGLQRATRPAPRTRAGE